MTAITAAEYQALMKGKSKPTKQHQGSSKGKAPPQQQVRTTGTLEALQGYSPVKQDVLNQIQDLHAQASKQLYGIPEAEYSTQSPEVWTFMRMCRSAIEIVKILKF